MNNVEPRIRVQAEDFDTAAEIDRLTRDRRGVGAVVTFSGLCRDEAGTLAALEIEHYAGMAELEIGRIARTTLDRWSLTGLTVVHRYGLIKPGENIVLVVTASAHRQAAFEGASFLMDYLKNAAPFWKKQHLVSGKESDWVETKAKDKEAFKRWHSL
ncbi:molybdenum cofactor biosynthesis protein MoaE [Phyllobacterium endophyticum]|jgi:molybdopterin synthase catalytic subunit|uniref:Molybdopterin synthase catalytic subunit n=1 Tax=Phyllobacterium endophyticum TaxID=1149773 RepID=A0A2P7AWJ3_9HYPH|nr:molybdenum cofactor biosynthesis protein MoaE [Phyllobacterium endophyticum]MBB3235209.1 molybdopterin synthase catalytic subunit [Phyllobacterium endophyticum]PSH58585.1 molybdopterin synthase catalytic subunit [Phyllobacterium endophyticum]TXR49047.1 molybdenum cofactor biosynthesis protein MoaE [Phyllobacterium endophyticum]TYR39268.1 molybdenum cofactor biosynthesis protein MoaE [Phyllobacterium endophyticum]